MHKFFYVYEGTYTLKKRVGKDTYIILSDNGKEKDQFHMNNMKPYFEKIRNRIKI